MRWREPVKFAANNRQLWRCVPALRNATFRTMPPLSLPDRYWLITWTTYGSWLPGDRRGSTSPIRLASGRRVRRNVYGTPPADAQPALERAVRRTLSAPPVRLTEAQAEAVLSAIRRTARSRGWALYACAVMANHAHVVVGVPGDPDPSYLLRDLKGYGSRSLNAGWANGSTRRWWTRSGSHRVLRGEPHVIAAVRYVRSQYHPLVTWVTPGFPD